MQPRLRPRNSHGNCPTNRGRNTTETEVHEILEGTGALDPQRQREARQVAQQLRAVTEAQPPGSGALVALVDNLIETADLFDEVGQ